MTLRNVAKPRRVHSVADYFLMIKVNASAGDTISNLKLQKLCYFAQAASLVYLNKPLFDDEIEAWAHGPVVKKLYRRFKKFKWLAVDPYEAKRVWVKKLSAEEMRFLDRVWDVLSPYSAKELEIMSHQTPWKEQYKPAKTFGRCNNVISPESIKAYYASNQQPEWFKKIAPCQN